MSAEEQPKSHLTVSSIMNKKPVMVRLDATVEHAAKAMARKGIDSCLVKSKGKIVGIVTERDIVRRVVAKGLSPKKTKVETVMTTPITIVTPNLTVEEAAKVMADKGIRRLPVVEKGTLVGMVTIAELAQALRQEVQKAEAKVTEYVLQAITRKPPEIYE